MFLQILLFQVIMRFNLVSCFFESFTSPRFSCSSLHEYTGALQSEKNNCKINIDIFEDLSTLVARAGYELEIHKVVTNDGYVISLFRIPPRVNGAQPILGVHGVASSAAHCFGFGNDSLAFMAYNNGYDLWMISMRGTSYSLGHLTWATDDFEYWDFNLDTLVTQDIRKTIEYVSEKTNQKVIYMGYSMGATLGAMYSSKYVGHSEKYLKGQVMIAPVLYTGTINLILRQILTITVQVILKITQLSNYLRSFVGRTLTYLTPRSKYIFAFACCYLPVTCAHILTGINEYTVPENLLLIPSMNEFPHFGEILHYSQLENGLKEYDYGDGNLKAYGQSTPPKYNLAHITIPTFGFYGNRDESSKGLKEEFQLIGAKEKKIFHIPQGRKEGFGHLNFINAKNIWGFFHMPLLDTLDYLRTQL